MGHAKNRVLLLGAVVMFGSAACSDAPWKAIDAAQSVDAGAQLGGGRYLVYNRRMGGHKHLFRSKSDGTGELQLTSGDSDNVYPELAGTTLYLSSGGRNGDNFIKIWTMKLDGTDGTDGTDLGVVPIALPNAHLFQASYCGDYLVFAAVVPGVHDHLEVYRVAVGGGTPVRLTTTTLGHPQFIWGQLPHCDPQHKQIIYSSTQSGSTEIWRMNVDGSNQVQLTFTQQRSPTATCVDYRGTTVRCYDDCNAPSWSVDGRITMYCGIEQQHGEVFLMNPDGTNQVQLTNDPGIQSNDDPEFSPDGAYVLFTHGDPGTQLTTLQRVAVDGSGRTTLVEGLGENYSSTWGG